MSSVQIQMDETIENSMNKHKYLNAISCDFIFGCELHKNIFFE